MSGATIPTAFWPFDTRVTDPDQVVNIRDRCVMARNFNILIARRMRQPLLTLGLSGDTDSITALAYDFGSRPLDEGIALRRWFVSCPVFLPPRAQSCTLNLYCYQTSNTAPDADVDVRIYARLFKPGDPGSVLVAADALAAVDCEAAGITKKSCTVVCPRDHTDEDLILFQCYAQTPHLDADVKGGGHETIYGVGSNTIDLMSAGGGGTTFNLGDILYILDSGSALRTDILPRQVIARYEIDINGSSGYRYTVDAPWTGAINAGSDLADGKSVNNLHVKSLVLYANAVTDPTAWIDR